MMKLMDRNISWIRFNNEVSDETMKNIPLAERVMFHGIVHSNLDEFLLVRYPIAIPTNTEKELTDFVEAISKHYSSTINRWRKFNKEHQIIKKIKDLGDRNQKWSEKYFKDNIYPTLQPITVDKSRPANLHAGIYLLVVTMNKDNEQELVNYIEIPGNISRFIQVPDKNYCIAIEDLIEDNLKYIFKDRKIVDSFAFSIIRSAEVYLHTDQYLNPLTQIIKTLKEREKAWITRVEVGSMKKKNVKVLRNLLNLNQNTLIFNTDMVKLSDLKSITSGIYEDKDKSRKLTPYNTWPASSVFDYIRKEDRLAFHPFESYQTTMVRFLEEAAEDPDVVSIKITLYRVSDNSKIIDALLRAADQGKNVTVLIELKARFDEHHNIEVSKALQEGGVRIVYTDPNMKTHAKVCLVTRKEKKGIKTYAQVGTGNYSESNAKQYTDYSYFTCDPEICSDLTRFFNLLTSDQGRFKSQSIVYAPYNMREEIDENIDREIKRAKKGKKAKIICKCNSLTDDKIAEKLVEAAKAGVKVTLIIRGACIVHEAKNMKVYSIVGRFLEHSRLYIFGAGKDARMYIGSADIMHRNLSLRNELLIRITNRNIQERLYNHIKIYLSDNTNKRTILDKYEYHEPDRKKDDKPFTAQEMFIKEAKKMSV